jgi:predicted transporter
VNYVYASVVGILIAIFIFGLKTGVWCGFSSIKKRDLLILATAYFVISVTDDRRRDGGVVCVPEENNSMN